MNFKDWKYFVEVMRDQTKEDLYKKIVDDLLETKILSLYPKDHCIVMWENCVPINPRTMPYRATRNCILPMKRMLGIMQRQSILMQL